MTGLRRAGISGAFVACICGTVSAQTEATGSGWTRGLRPVNVRIAPTAYRGRDAVRLVEAPDAGAGHSHAVAIVPGDRFVDGSIELAVAAQLAPGADSAARGFIGIAFDVDSSAGRFKSFYLRPTNGRADDQLRRNHATQFVALPAYPWHRLRREEPGVYESYADMEAGAWTAIRIVIEAGRGLLYINGAVQPALVVNDMKDPARGGSVALWIGPGTVGYFTRPLVTHARRP